jgi:hypothetical protein
MIKNTYIKELQNKRNVVIQCFNQMQWETCIKLLESNLSPKLNNYRTFGKDYLSPCIDISGKLYSHHNFYKNQGYDIIPAEIFIANVLSSTVEQYSIFN